MGYKLAGFNVLGGIEIDPEMMEIYRANHRPKHSYLMGVEEFNKIPDEELPAPLFSLDILDGSPPCSSFSTAGVREKKWGKRSKFREGQAEQVLDDLFFHFIATANKLKPRVVIAENVKGLVTGKARGYVREIFRSFEGAGYNCQLFVLNACRMGVPQARERTFFVAHRGSKPLELDFSEQWISTATAFEGCSSKGAKTLPPSFLRLWGCVEPGQSLLKAHGKSFFTAKKLWKSRPSQTQTASSSLLHFDEPRFLSPHEAIRLQTFPEDFDFRGSCPIYVCGMSVPPFMMERVATEVKNQWLNASRSEVA